MTVRPASAGRTRTDDELRAEIRRRHAALADLERSYAMLRAYQEASPDGLLILDLEGKVLESNARFSDLWKIAPEATGGRARADILTCLLDRVKDGAAFHELIRRLDANRLESRRNEPFALKDGTLLLVTTWPVILSDGRPVARSWCFRDVTSERAHESGLQHAQKLEILGTLAGGVAHDFNNLLTAIGGHVALAMREVAQGGQAHRGLVIAARAVERASDLTRTLLNFGRRTPTEPRPLDLRDVVAETVKLIGRVIDPRITIETRSSETVWRTLADPGQINQLLTNICVNARDAMPEGGRILIETSNQALAPGDARSGAGHPPGEYVVLAVSDDGAGMSPEVLSRIYEPFFTTKEEGKGTGLGLSIVQGIVQQHRGWIECESRPGRGTTFLVFFPREVGEQAAETERQKKRSLGGHETILLVDDAELVRILGQQVLEPLGYTVILAEDGVEALEAFTRNRDRIDLVILDLLMPRRGGQEVFRDMRSMVPDLPIIISTGYDAQGVFERLGNAGPVVSLNKPYMPRELARLVRDMLDYAKGSARMRAGSHSC